ncbi:MAG: AmmeMemoRadiSam system protein A, partial [Candidatus Bathyarchaeia archaeon]
MNLNEKEKKMLLDLAKKTIESELGHTKFKIEKEKIPSRLREKKATFVTLTIDGQLRGCMGHLLPSRELYLDVIENAKAAAFYDPRFLPLRKDEFSKIQIEISILSLPQKIN